MSSQNLGEQEGKPDFGFIFDDFPNCWDNEFALVINEEYYQLKDKALKKITIVDLYEARAYGVKKYSRFNWRESMLSDDHENFMAANRRSIYRHLVAISMGETIDKDSGCKHWAMVALRCMIAVEYITIEGAHRQVVEPPLNPLRDRTDLGAQGDLANYRTKKTYQIVDFVKNGSFRCDNCDRQSRCHDDFGEGGVNCKLDGTQIYKETRFDWSNAPSYAKYAAIDSDGEGWWYPICPQLVQTRFFGYGTIIGISMLREGEDWRTTLEESPK